MRVVALLVGVSVSVCGVAPGNGVEAPAPLSLRCARCFASRAEWDVTGAPPHGREFRQHTAARSDALLGDHPDRTSKVIGQGSYRVSGACAGVDGSMWEYLGAAGEEVDSGNSSEFDADLDDAKQAFMDVGGRGLVTRRLFPCGRPRLSAALRLRGGGRVKRTRIEESESSAGGSDHEESSLGTSSSSIVLEVPEIGQMR
jgi:hypothetical protein